MCLHAWVPELSAMLAPLCRADGAADYVGVGVGEGVGVGTGVGTGVGVGVGTGSGRRRRTGADDEVDLRARVDVDALGRIAADDRSIGDRLVRLAVDRSDAEAEARKRVAGLLLGLAAQTRGTATSPGPVETMATSVEPSSTHTLRLAADDASLVDVLRRLFLLAQRQVGILRLRPKCRQRHVVAVRDQLTPTVWLGEGGPAEQLDAEEADRAEQEHAEHREQPQPPRLALVLPLLVGGGMTGARSAGVVTRGGT